MIVRDYKRFVNHHCDIMILLFDFCTRFPITISFLFQPQSVPKVIVMGSSTASETTINTSTDSSNTIVTTMTATDGDVTEDSLDMNETSCDILNSDNILDGGKILQPTPVTPKTPATAKERTPPTAKEERKFVFDTVQTPKARDGDRFVFDQPQNEINHVHEEKSVEKLMEQQIEALKLEARRRSGYRVAQNDLDKIEVMQERGSPQREQRRSVRRGEHGDKSGRSSPNRGGNSSETHSPKPKHRHKKTSRKHHSPNRQKNEKFVYDERYIAR